MEKKHVKGLRQRITKLNRVISSLIDIDREIESEYGVERPKEYYDLKRRTYRAELFYWVGEILNDAGVRQFENDNLDEAVELFTKCIDYVPTLYEAYNNLGVVLAKQGQYDLALEMIRRALSINDNNRIANLNLQRIAAHQVGSTQLAQRELGASLQVGLEPTKKDPPLML